VTLAGALYATQIAFLAYFVVINIAYMLISVLTLTALRRHMERHVLHGLPHPYSGLETPTSVLVPAYNEALTIATSVRSLLQLDYPEYEVIVVNDGSSDATLKVLTDEFRLVPFPEAYRKTLACGRIRGIYRSTAHPNLRVIDKENGGKADALNAAINAARFPLFCAVDADSVLQRDSLWRIVEPFLEDPRTIASGGTVRIANGCQVEGGFLVGVGLPRKALPRFQIVEYLRAFLFGRLGWTSLNAMMVISGAFGVFSRERVVEAGGYRSDCMGEDMELVVRLHRLHRLTRRPYRICFVPDPVCWTEVPESLDVLKKQRIRWQRGLSESLFMNLRLLFHRRGGAPGWLAMPFMLLFEWFSPLIELAGYIFMVVGFALGIVAPEAILLFFMVAVGFGMLLSVSTLLLEEISFHMYRGPHQLMTLLTTVVMENFGYRQLTTYYRLLGWFHWLTGSRPTWGRMTRAATWQKTR
jgi:cellulose synthase/poly-beta-1,6-N-acetylglucosamine synthase-like glycosyltransferase